MKRLRLLLPAMLVVWLGCIQGSVEREGVTFPSDERVWVTGAAVENPAEFSYSNAIVTPCVAWATPYAEGTTRVLFVSRWQGGRDVVEMMERFDLDVRAVTLDEADANLVSEAFLKELNVLKALQAWHASEESHPASCIVLGGVNWSTFSEDVRKAIHELVKSGVGLVLIDMIPVDAEKSPLLAELSPFAGAESETAIPASRWEGVGSHYVTQGIPIAALPAARARKVKLAAGTPLAVARDDRRPVLASHKVGAGRIVAFNVDTLGGNTGLLAPVVGNAPTGQWWEEQYALVGRAILWTAGKESTRRIASLTTSMQVYPPEKADAVQIEIAFEDEATCTACRRVDLVVNDSDGREVWRSTRNRATRGSSREAFAPRRIIGGGALTARAMARDERGRVLDFASCAFGVQPPVRIAGLDLDKTVVTDGEPLSGNLRLNGYSEKGLLAEVTIVDSLGRTCGVRREPLSLAGANSLAFHFDTSRMRTRQGTVLASLTLDGATVDRLDRRFGAMAGSDSTPFEVLMPEFTLMPQLKEAVIHRMRAAGVTVSGLTTGRYGMTTLLDADTGGMLDVFDAAPVEAEYVKMKDVKTLVRKPGLRKRVELETALNTFTGSIRSGVGGLPGLISLTRTPGYAEGGEVSFDEQTLGVFRSFLNQRYGTLDALDDAWGSSYSGKSWNDVMPGRLDSGLIPAWLEHRTFESLTYLATLDYFAKATHEAYPYARVGVIGTRAPTANNGLDPVGLYRTLDWAAANWDEGQLELQKLYRGNCALYAIMPEGLGEDETREFLWRAVFNRQMGLMSAGAQDVFYPDYTFTPHGAVAGRETRRIRDGGFASLVSSLQDSPTAIAVWYDYAAQLAAEGNGLDADLGALRLMMDAISRLGFQPDGLTTKDIADGKVLRYDVLFAPYAAALSDGQVAKLSEFVKQGGILVSGPAAGTLNEVGRRREKSVGELLGFTRVGMAKLSERAEGEPMLVAAESGEGLSVAMTVNLSEWGSLDEDARDKAVVDFCDELGKALRARRVVPRVSVTVGEGKMVDGEVAPGFETVFDEGEVFTFERGDHFFVGILKEATSMGREPIIVRLDRQGYLYDATVGKYIGFGRGLTSSIGPGEGKLYSVLPYKVERVRIDAGPADRRGVLKMKVTIETNIGSAARDHVLIVDVMGPDGRRIDAYSGPRAAEGRTVEVSVPLVLSDAPGKWTVRVHDVLSGVIASRSIEVR